MKRKDPAGHSGYYPNGHYAGSPTRKARKPKRKAFFYAGAAACVCVFVVCAVLLTRYYGGIAASRDASSRLGEIYEAGRITGMPSPTASAEPENTPAQAHIPAAAVTGRPAAAAYTAAPDAAPNVLSAAEIWPSVYPDNPKLSVSPVFDELQSQNRDIVAWLKIDGELEEPVVQRDNSYYLTHNALRQESVTGALFLDETCDLIHVPTQMVIHGHNMKEGAMFGMLKKYKVKGASFYKDHAYIDFNTLYENGRYVIFAVSEVDIRPGQPHYLPFWHYSRFDSAAEFNSYVSAARASSQYHCTVDVEPGDRLLTLSTCTGSDDNKRLVVMARKIREGEDLLALNMAVLSAYDK